MRTPLVVLGAVLLVCAPAAPALAADPLADAQARATALRTQLDALQTRTELAVEAYDDAQDELARRVAARVRSEEQLQQARTAESRSGAVRDARVRSLYAVGGPAALYSSVLTATTPTEVLQGVHSAQRLLAVDDRTRAAEQTASAALDARSRQAQDAAREQVAEQARVSALVQQVEGLLADQRRLVDGADAEVGRIAAEQAAEAARQAEAAFAAQQAAAAAAAAAAVPAPGAPGLGAGLAPAAGPAGAVPGGVAAAIADAKAQLGKPYVWGATGPSSYDCSGLTGHAYAAAGVHLPRTSRGQWGAGRHVALGDLLPGDLLFWAADTADPGTIHHVAMYLGDGLMIAAPHTGTVVQVQKVYADGYIGATRVLG